jgi:hypothetical protein
MSRNAIKYSKNIFNLLSQGLTVLNLDKMKVLNNPDELAFEREKNIFNNASKLEVDYILNNVKVGKFSYGNEEYLLITQIDSNNPTTQTVFDSLENTGIFTQEINAGLFLFLVTDASLQRILPVSLSELEQNIFFDQYDDDYHGHDFSVLMKFIENFTVFKIDANSAFIGRNYIETGYFICSKFDKFIRLPIEPLINDYIDILQEQSAVLKENVFLSLTATHYKHAFIELYRCIEILYILPRSIQLKAKLAYSKLAYELARHCIDELGWRKREEDSLCRILKDINEAVIATSGIQTTTFADVGWVFDGSDSQKKSHEALARKIYKIRNQLVHQLHLDDEIIIADSDWNLLIKFTLNVIKDAYRVYKSDLPPSFS